MSTILGDDVDDFEIEREGQKYEVRLQIRVNDAKDPLQVTVINLRNPDDTDFIKINPLGLEDQELISMLDDRLQVYTKIVEGETLIDYVALLQNSVKNCNSNRTQSSVRSSDEAQWNKVASASIQNSQRVTILLERAKKVNLRAARLSGNGVV